MDKILVEISCPATSKTYDFWISSKMSIKDVKERAMAEIREFEKNEAIFMNQQEVYLYRKDKNCLAQEVLTVEDSGMRSGETLVLI